MSELLYEGKAKQIWTSDNEDEVIIKYKDTATAFNGVKKEDIAGKGLLNCKISNIIFKMLEKNGVPTHMIDSIDDKTIRVKKCEIVPLEVIIRNVAAGSFSKRFGVPEGTELKNTTLEYCYKCDDLDDPMINDYQILALGLATREELDKISELTFKINDLLIDFFAGANMNLIDFKIEFGRYKGDIILADEISPDSCRLWDKTTGEKMDKDRFRRDMGKVIEAYEEVARRIENE